MNKTAIRGFYKLCISTLVAVYILILVGGVVRSTGSGMGCPDWPHCFGQWVPPTSVNQLPSDYKEIYSQYRHAKNVKFARYLSAIGMQETGDQILNDESIREEADFNPAKTIVEYINRLVGVTIGLFIIVLFVRSVPFRKTNPILFYLSLVTLVLVIVQGWFGSIVVSTNLTTWTITIHMFLALVIVAVLFYLLKRSDMDAEEHQVTVSRSTYWLLVCCMVVLLIQVFLGTAVREQIDIIATSVLPRNEWIENVGIPFIVHRTFSWVVLGLHLILLFNLRKTTGDKTLPRTLIILILGTLLTGGGMAYFGVPPYLQPVHLVLATVIFGLQLNLFFRLNTVPNYVLTN